MFNKGSYFKQDPVEIMRQAALYMLQNILNRISSHFTSFYFPLFGTELAKQELVISAI